MALHAQDYITAVQQADFELMMATRIQMSETMLSAMVAEINQCALTDQFKEALDVLRGIHCVRSPKAYLCAMDALQTIKDTIYEVVYERMKHTL